MRSTNDGKDWELHKSGDESQSWASVTYGNGNFVAVGATAFGDMFTPKTYLGSTMISTDDGITWSAEAVLPSPLDKNDWKSVTFGNGVFVAVAGNDAQHPNSYAKSMSSLDGISWSAHATLIDGVGEQINVAFGNQVFIAAGDSYDEDTGAQICVMTSANNGDSWTDPKGPCGGAAIAYGGGVFVLVGYASTSMRSLDNGKSWTNIDLPIKWWKGIVFGNNMFYAADFYGILMVSKDLGLSWTLEATFAARPCLLACGGTTCIAVSASGPGNATILNP